MAGKVQVCTKRQVCIDEKELKLFLEVRRLSSRCRRECQWRSMSSSET